MIYFVLGCLILGHVNSSPIDNIVLFSDGEDSENYDIIIDQRQNGTQNFRIKVSGVNIAIPDDRHDENQDASSGSTAPSLENFASILAATSLGAQTSSSSDDYSELAALFDWKKSSKSESQKKVEDTQSRTKDIPTDVQRIQLPEDSKSKIKNIVKDEQKKYRLLVGEKYIVPILRFLKKQTEEE